MSMFVEVEKLPSSFSRILMDSPVIKINSYLAHRSDRIAAAVFGEENVALDILLVRMNSTSPLRVTEGFEFLIFESAFLRQDLVNGT